MRLLGDGDGLFHRLDEVIRFVAHVGAVDAPVNRRFPAERDELLAVGETSRHIDEPRGKSQGAHLHVLPDQRLHGRHFRGRRRPVLSAEDSAPQRAVTHESGVVDSDALAFQLAEEALQIAPDEGNVVLLGAIAPPFLIVELGEGKDGIAAVAGDFRGDALADLAFRPGIDEEFDVGVAVRIDKAGGHGHAPGIDDGAGTSGCDTFGQQGDAIPLHGKVHFHTQMTEAVIDTAVDNQ